MHNHWCDVVGHEYECSNECCKCICGFAMEGHDHSDCPIELRPCHAHPEPNVDLLTERSPDAVEMDLSILSRERQQSLTSCNCGCAALKSEESVGICLWCSHQYAAYSPECEDDHFAYHCPRAPAELKESARKRLPKPKV